MKLILFFILMLGFQYVGSIACGDIIEIHEKIDVLLSGIEIDEKNGDISWVGAENRDQVLNVVLGRLNESNDRSRKGIEAVLVRLGHVETIKMLVERKVQMPGAPSRALSAANEVAIPHLMPLVYHGSMENPNKSGSDVLFFPVRNYAIQLVLGCIIRGREFPAETRQWAEKMANWHDPNSMTTWWERNQAAILEKRYADATWLPRYKGRPSTLDVEEMAEREQDRQRLWVGFSLFVGLALAFYFWRTSVRSA